MLKFGRVFFNIKKSSIIGVCNWTPNQSTSTKFHTQGRWEYFSYLLIIDYVELLCGYGSVILTFKQMQSHCSGSINDCHSRACVIVK